MQPVVAVVREQTDVIMRFGRGALSDLTTEELFWRPAPASWTVQREATGWVADWMEPEPEQLPPPTLAWQLWHCCWWLSMVIDHSFGDGRLHRANFDWAGPDVGFDAIVQLHDCWREHCDGLDAASWDDGDLVRWPYTDGRSFTLLAGWVSMELTKNLAEMAQARNYLQILAATGPSTSQ